MAVTATSLSSDLVLEMDNGTGASGQQLVKNRTYKNVKTSAVNDDVYAIAQSLIGLQDKSNLAIQRKDTVELESE
ncbi:MAG: DUF1659 domain-containing protein [Bacillota bacterium]|nr:DUF1659 domain-containing protein [Bacillota bacterium]MEA1960505.1 DUF1659 domain-containing protein [Bacillota bacterium]